uniref:Uncharacterized protein n=1 Tax=Plectus sambesii TaxID=2011161 RepID=A0A914XR21_9BILA
MRVIFYVKTVQLLVAICMALLMSKPIELCSEGGFDKLLLDKDGACHRAVTRIMRTLHAPFDADDNDTSSAINASSQIFDDADIRAVATNDENASHPHTARQNECGSQMTTRVCWTLGFTERFCRLPTGACLEMTGLLVALFAVSIIIIALLIQMGVAVQSAASLAQQPETLRSLLIALLWLLAAASMTVMSIEWSNGWRKRRVQPAFPHEWLVVLVLSWMLMFQSMLETFLFDDALHTNVRFERLTGCYDVALHEKRRRPKMASSI